MDTQQENRVIQQLKSAIRDFSPSITLDPKPTLDNVRNTIRVFMRNHPEIFWFSNQYRYDETLGILELKYNFTEEKAKFFEGEIKKVLFDDFQIEHVKTLSESERLV